MISSIICAAFGLTAGVLIILYRRLLSKYNQLIHSIDEVSADWFHKGWENGVEYQKECYRLEQIRQGLIEP